jgi:AcrR family transcriptional regulator
MIVNRESLFTMAKQRAAKRPAAERRRSILEGAQEVFATSGYANVGTSDVARAAGVAPSAIYRHFPNKRALYLETLRQAAPRLLKLWRDAGRRHGDPLESLRDLGLQYYDHAADRATFTKFWFQAIGEADDPEVREIVAENFKAFVETIQERIEAAMRSGSGRSDVDPRIAAWHFMAIGLTFDLIHHLQLDDELDRARVEAWGELYIQSLREKSYGNEPPNLKRGEMPLREHGRESDTPGGGDPLSSLPQGSPDPLETDGTGESIAQS